MILLRERFLVLEPLLCDAGGTSRAPSAEPRAQGPKARSAGLALRGVGNGRGASQSRFACLLLGGSRGQTSHGRFEGMVGGGAPLVSFHVRPQYSDPESRWHAAFSSLAGLYSPLESRLCESGSSWISTPFVSCGFGGQKLEIAASHAGKRFFYRGRTTLSDQGGPPPHHALFSPVEAFSRIVVLLFPY